MNQGHCHPKILAAMVEQAGKLTLNSRAFHNDQLAPGRTILDGERGLMLAVELHSEAGDARRYREALQGGLLEGHP
jgi:ornithine--oxo-acid transaminase